ncbi:hypothetical protein EV401DRAFT_2069774 [Pisolithus croceorrhizus]|nr:hypothetical protein EV401DRAFT_2069774 [Pisolithus croceorrhizus]
MSPVSVCNIPEEFRDLARWRNGNNLVLIVAHRRKFLRVEGAHVRSLGGRLDGAAVWPYEDFSAVSRRSASIQVAPPPTISLVLPTSLQPILIIHNHPIGCRSRLEVIEKSRSSRMRMRAIQYRTFVVRDPLVASRDRFECVGRSRSGRLRAIWVRSVKSVGMSSMLFGDCAGGAVSGDSLTLRESAYPLLVASPCPHLPFSPLPEVSRDLVRVRNGKTAMYGVTTLLSSFHHMGVGPRWSLEGVYSCWEAFLVAQQHFLDSMQVDEVLASCVITSTTGIPSLIRLLLGHIPMCFVVFDLMSMLSPLPARVGLCTPIP